MASLKALEQVLIQGKSLDEALNSEDQTDLNLIKFLSYGVLREYESLSFLLNQLLNKPLKAKEMPLKLILLLGLFQLKSSRIASHAAINETVNLAKLAQYDYASGLVNAILRRYLREQQDLLEKLAKQAISEHPAWLLNKIKTAYPNDWQKITEANNTQAPMHLRVNQRKGTRTDYLKLLNEHKIAADLPEGCNDAITLKEPINVSELPEFQQGFVSVQDLAAQQAAYLLDLQPGQNVLDACAAPGGKTSHILECADIDLISMDVSANRAELIKENLQRLGLHADIIVADAAAPQDFSEQFDRILIDAPCSGTGVIRRHPDIKFLRKAQDIEKLHQLQIKILTNLAPHLKSGGLMLYATCSILPEENDLTIETALEILKDFKVVELKIPDSPAFSKNKTQYGYQLRPNLKGSDGFYYSLLTKL